MEPLRSRLLIGVGAVLAAANVLAQSWRADGPGPWWFPVAVLSFFLLPVCAVAGFLIWASTRALRDMGHRPARFTLAHGGFTLRPLVSPGLLAMQQLTIAGFFVGSAVRQWRRSAGFEDFESTADFVFFGVLAATALVTVLAMVPHTIAGWRGNAVELTQAGIRIRTPSFRRMIPWAALAPGGPPRPAADADQLHLVVVRPELVTQRGWGIGTGPRERPVVSLQVDVHPWFVADAISWYVEHPEERAAIGTADGHDRLVAALTGPAPARESLSPTARD